MKKNIKNHVIIIGAGPSGLSAAKEFIDNEISVSIIEKNNTVGGLARTIKYKDCSYDIGPHRFYTLNNEYIGSAFPNIDSINIPGYSEILTTNIPIEIPINFNLLTNIVTLFNNPNNLKLKTTITVNNKEIVF